MLYAYVQKIRYDEKFWIFLKTKQGLNLETIKNHRSISSINSNLWQL